MIDTDCEELMINAITLLDLVLCCDSSPAQKQKAMMIKTDVLKRLEEMHVK